MCVKYVTMCKYVRVSVMCAASSCCTPLTYTHSNIDTAESDGKFPEILKESPFNKNPLDKNDNDPPLPPHTHCMMGRIQKVNEWALIRKRSKWALIKKK